MDELICRFSIWRQPSAFSLFVFAAYSNQNEQARSPIWQPTAWGDLAGASTIYRSLQGISVNPRIRSQWSLLHFGNKQYVSRPIFAELKRKQNQSGWPSISTLSKYNVYLSNM